MAGEGLTCRCFVMMPDGRSVPVEELTREERDQWRENMRRRLSEDMSAYFTQHPERYAQMYGGR